MGQVNRVLLLSCTMVCLSLLGGCKGTPWIAGKWLLVTPDGKPGVCYEFSEKTTFKVYAGPDCEGATDPLLSGKFQLKEDTKLAVLRGQEKEAHLALITDRAPDHFVSRGALAGQMYRVGAKGGSAMIDELREKGVVKVRMVPEAMGCKQLGMPIAKITALPKEAAPRMLRQRDQGLQYHVQKATGDEDVEKIVFAVNQDVVDWVAFHYKESAFKPPGPQERMEKLLGAPVDTAKTGAGEDRQHIVMWRCYCGSLRGAHNQDVDVTLFAMDGKKDGIYYVSEGVVSELWEDLKQTAAHSATEGGDEGGGGEASGSGASAAPAKAEEQPAKSAKSKSKPAKSKPAKSKSKSKSKSKRKRSSDDEI